MQIHRLLIPFFFHPYDISRAIGLSEIANIVYRACARDNIVLLGQRAETYVKICEICIIFIFFGTMLKYYFYYLYKVFQLKIITSFFFLILFGKCGILDIEMHFQKDEKIETKFFNMEDRIMNC